MSLEARPPLLSLPLTEEQGLTIGSVFTIRASNGVDSCRRLSLLGFCHSVDHLHEKVELVVRQRGGAVVSSERQLTRCGKGGECGVCCMRGGCKKGLAVPLKHSSQAFSSCVLRGITPQPGSLLSTRSALAERLHMCIAIPLLFGVPPEHERLRAGVLAGGGIIDRVVQQWLVGCVP